MVDIQEKQEERAIETLKQMSEKEQDICFKVRSRLCNHSFDK